MAISDQIQNYNDGLLDAYDTVQTRGGTVPTNKNLVNLPDAIDSIPSGGGAVEEKDVNFYDYDGTLVKSYTKQQFLNLTALPDNPTHEGLTSQGWNWGLSEAQTYVESAGMLDIGQMYITDDGATRVYVELLEGRTYCRTGWGVNGTIIIDWGDGSKTSSVKGTNLSRTMYTYHTYENTGNYVISITKGTTTTEYTPYESSSNRSPVFSSSGGPSDRSGFRSCVKKIEFGEGVPKLGSYGLCELYKLETITMPNTIVTFDTYSIQGCRTLKCLIIPKGATTFNSYCCSQCNSVEVLSLPNTVTSMTGSCFEALKIKKLQIPNSVTTLGNNAFLNNFLLEKVTIGTGVTNIASGAFSGNYTLRDLSILGNFTGVGGSAFANNYCLTYLKYPSSINYFAGSAYKEDYSLTVADFRSVTAIPEAGGASVYGSTPSFFKIVVPDELYEDWKVATNWTDFASKMVKASEYDD